MEITLATAKEADWLDEMIKQEFPYTTFTPKKIIERITSEKYLVLISKQKNILTGFAEVEFFFETKEARLNAVFVDDAWRGQRIGTSLVEQCINECKHKKIYKMFLLVKVDNEGAKHLYEETGFSFEKMHEKTIDDSKVEVWSINI